MSEVNKRNWEQDRLLALLEEEQHTIERDRRHEFLGANFFHLGHVWSFDSINVMAEELQRLATEFMADKKDGNMGERFDMALGPKYFGKIHVVELGHVRSDNLADFDEMTRQYHDLLHWLVINGIVEGELSRERSGREVGYRASEAVPSRAVIVRQRALVDGRIPVRNERGEIYGQAQFGIAKRAVFSVPLEIVVMVNERTKNSENRETAILEQWEQLLDEKHSAIHHIRAGYYMISDLL